MSLQPRQRDLESVELPSGWATAVLRELCLETGFADPAKTPDREFDYVDVSSVSSDSLKIVRAAKVRGAAAPSRARKVLRASDVIFATVRPTLRRVALVPPSLDGHLASTAFCVVRADTSRADPRFLYYALITERFIQRVGALERGASYPAVTDSNVLEQEILLPPLPEQHAIASVLSKLQAAVEVQDRIVAALKELKAATMTKLFREGLSGEPIKQSEIGEIPESWEVISLGDHCRVTSGGTPSREHPEYWGGPVPWVKTSEVNYRPIKKTEEYITESGLVNSAARLLPPGTLLMAMYGQGVTRGRVAFLEVKAATNQACAALHPDDDLDPGFLYAYLSFAYERIRELGHGANQPNLSGEIIRKIRIPLPPTMVEQRALHAVVGALDSALGVAERRQKIRSQVFRSMLGALVTGALRMPGSHKNR